MNKYAELLGESAGTAFGNLKKKIILRLLQEVNRDDCYRCGKPLDWETLHVDHIESWASSDNPIESFWSLENIGFSHAVCNMGASRRERTHCPSGHEYSDENTVRWKNKRQCRACKNARQRINRN